MGDEGRLQNSGPTENPPNDSVDRAANVFRYLREVKRLQSPPVSDVAKYDQVLWLSDIPKDKGCYCKAWQLIREEDSPERDAWVEIYKPKLQSPPEVPDGLDPFIRPEQLEDSSLDEPELLELSDEMLIPHFIAEDDSFEPHREELQIDEHEDIFEQYITYVDDRWAKWAERRRQNQELEEGPPVPPEALVPWLKMDALDDFTAKEPTLNDRIIVENDPRAEKAREKLTQAWAIYVETKWRPWAAEDRRLQKIQEVYNTLYTIYQRQQYLGEQYEVVLAFGFLAWNAPKSKTVRRHVLTVRCTLGFDAPRGIVSVGPTAEGDTPVLEYDMLEIADRPREQEMRFLQGQVDDLGETFWDQAKLRSLFEAWVNALSVERATGLECKGRYEHALERHVEKGSTPVISFAPAIILRKRSQRGFMQFLDRIEASIRNGGVIPSGVREITAEVGADERCLDGIDLTEESRGDIAARGTDVETYFPLPANREQMEIAHRLERGRGVLVQGPPGTGKSHTIVNMICHLLASGQRILVTSETNRALQALKTRFVDGAERLAQLCVILLGNDEDAFQQLERSISAISNKKNHWMQNRSTERISELRQHLDQVRRSKRGIANRLREIREQDTVVHEKRFGRYSGSLQQIACQIDKERAAYGWLKDVPKNVIDLSQLPFTPDEFIEKWREYRSSYATHTHLRRVPVEAVPPVERVKQAVDQYLELGMKLRDLSNRTRSDQVEALKDLDAETFSFISERAYRLLNGLVNLEQHVYGWAANAGREIVAEQDRAWRELWELSKEHIEKSKDIARDVSLIQVQGVDAAQVKVIRNHATKLLDYLTVRKKLGLKLFLPAEIKEAYLATKNIRVDGLPSSTCETVARLVKWLTVNEALIELQRLWAGRSQAPSGSFSITLAHYEDLLEPLELALSLHRVVRELQESVDAVPALKPRKWYVMGELQEFCWACDIVRLERESAAIEDTLEGWSQEIAAITGLDEDYRHRLMAAIRFRKSHDYVSAYEDLCEASEVTREFLELLACVQPVRESLPETFRDFEQNIEDDVWRGRFAELERATQWALADRWVAETCDPDTLQRLNDDYDRLNSEEMDLIGKLAEELAWQHCMRRLTEKERQSLVAWLQAMENIGKGYGRHVERHRRTASAKMEQCRSAIPAWVMPLHRVVETVPAQPGVFDVAIIDEASQSGPEALILNYLAKKVIVVGDEKQIRPRYVGINHDDVEYLRRMYLKDIPHSESFDLHRSYFSIAELKFPNYIRLHEHFRCMPEIIQFSNNNFYTSEPLIPLRQYGASRLEPVVDTYFVKDGYRMGRHSDTVNLPEARAIVDKIAECCADPDYDGKSMGVITLLGNKQAVEIESLLVKEIDASEIEARRLTVGVPYTFQGDERDVIFLSMVDAPQDGRRCRLVDDQESQRLFNVAASRARDQMWLFHSATFNDLRAGCLRYRLLSHCKNPRVEQPDIDGIAIDELRRLARYSERTRGNQPSPFDSWFEVDVFLDIVSRGYRVIPQYRVNPYEKYRIDIVVEGVQGRLAVECDGDRWHGLAEYERDMARQRDLIRCGWRFWRIRGGAYYRDRQAALVTLWAELERARIFPTGTAYPVAEVTTQPAHERQEPVRDTRSHPRLSLFEIDSEPESAGEGTYPVGSDGDDSVEDAGERRKASTISAKDIQKAILAVLDRRPNHSIALRVLTKEVCRELSLFPRGNPRREFDKRIRRSVGVLKRRNLVKEYKAKNVRIRLIGQ